MILHIILIIIIMSPLLIVFSAFTYNAVRYLQILSEINNPPKEKPPIDRNTWHIQQGHKMVFKPSKYPKGLGQFIWIDKYNNDVTYEQDKRL
jgi:hypothetical protein